ISGTYQRRKLFYWATEKEEIKTWAKEGEIFQRAKHENDAHLGLLQPLPTVKEVWPYVSIDLTKGLPNSEAKESLLVVVDRLTKYSHFLPLRHPYTIASIAKIFFDNIYKLHGFPVSIVNDKNNVLPTGGLIMHKMFTSRAVKWTFFIYGRLSTNKSDVASSMRRGFPIKLAIPNNARFSNQRQGQRRGRGRNCRSKGRGVREEFEARKSEEAVREGSGGEGGVADDNTDNGDCGGWGRGLKVGGAL
ncbi:UNVERIFIED_CONTAM: hypothetical protein Sangu_3175800, partial [Sesamum angustifolium]